MCMKHTYLNANLFLAYLCDLLNRVSFLRPLTDRNSQSVLKAVVRTFQGPMTKLFSNNRGVISATNWTKRKPSARGKPKKGTHLSKMVTKCR
jgi:hypothetical protein